MNSNSSKIKPKSQGGFSLLELLVAVTLIVGLAAIALPNYNIYKLKVKAAEFMFVLGPYKGALQEWINSSEAINWPATNEQMYWPESQGKYVDSVSYQRGTDNKQAYVVVNGFLDDDKSIAAELILIATIVEQNVIQWSCLAQGVSKQYFPASCNDVNISNAP